MEARTKAPYRVVTAFAGREFVGYEWRPVPAGKDAEAHDLEAAGYLELKEQPAAVKVAPEPEPEAVESPKPVRKRRSRKAVSK